MRHRQQDRSVFLSVLHQQADYLLAMFPIQGRRRFVGEQDRWAMQHRSRDGHSLPLSAAELARWLRKVTLNNSAELFSIGLTLFAPQEIAVANRWARRFDVSG